MKGICSSWTTSIFSCANSILLLWSSGASSGIPLIGYFYSSTSDGACRLDHTGNHRLTMMTSCHGNFFRITSPLRMESTGSPVVSLTKASNAELWWLVWSSCWTNSQVTSDLRHGDASALNSHYHDVSCQIALTPNRRINPSFNFI